MSDTVKEAIEKARKTPGATIPVIKATLDALEAVHAEAVKPRKDVRVVNGVLGVMKDKSVQADPAKALDPAAHGKAIDDMVDAAKGVEGVESAEVQEERMSEFDREVTAEARALAVRPKQPQPFPFDLAVFCERVVKEMRKRGWYVPHETLAAAMDKVHTEDAKKAAKAG